LIDCSDGRMTERRLKLRAYSRFARRGYSDKASPGKPPKAVRDLGHANVGISQQRLGGLDVVVDEFRRTLSGAARAPRRREVRLSALPDQAAPEFRQSAKYVKNQPSLRGRRVQGLRSGCETRCLSPESFRWFRSIASSSAANGMREYLPPCTITCPSRHKI
jgi:hypothetical protein